MSPRVSKSIEPFCTSVVIGKDIVSRTSLKTLEVVRDKLVYSLIKSKYNKFLLQTYLTSGKKFYKEEQIFNMGKDIDEYCRKIIQQYKESSEKLNHEPIQQARIFVPPGRIIFICPRPKINAKAKGFNESEKYDFDAVYINPIELI